MDKRILTYLILGGFLFAPMITSESALANDDPYLILLPNELDKPLEIEPFSYKEEIVVEPSLLINDPKSPQKEYRSKSSVKKEEFEDQILALVPHGQKMKQLWYIVDGDTDLYFEGLRADKGNMGVKYTTNAMPLIGEIRGTEFKFSAGKDMEFGFESNRIPLIGEVKGFRLKGSVSDDAKISARYTMKFD